jgi:DNA-binding transcriptional MerR regulator
MLTIGQLAAQTGATPRALRLYERRGLLKADRTAAGRRTYGAEHIIVLAQINTLKSMGLTLAEIGKLMQRRTLDASALIEFRLAQVEAEQARLTALAGTLRAASAALSAGPIDAAALAKLLADPAAVHFQQIIDRWFSPAEQEDWRATVPNMRRSVLAALTSRAKAAVAAGIAPESHEGMAIAADWYAAMLPAMAAAGKERWNRGAAMFLATEGGGDEADAVHVWLFKAIPAALDAGQMGSEGAPSTQPGKML